MNEMNEKAIVETYRKSEFNTRLNLYLQWPQLRSEFIMIDRRALRAELSQRDTDRASSWWAALGERFNDLAIDVRKRFGNASAS